VLEHRRSGRTSLTVVPLLLASLTLITLDVRSDAADALREGATDALAPVRSLAEDLLDPLGDALHGVTGYGDLEDENADLRARLAAVEGDRSRVAAAEREVREALGVLDVPWVGDLPAVGARVVSAPVSNFEQTVELGKGSADGIAVDMPVVAADGLVGRVASVSRRRSVVQLVTDPDMSVGVVLTRSGDQGAADGEGPGRSLSLSFVEAATRVGRRELVVTSGLQGGRYPAGLPVGHVARRAAGTLSQHVEVEPAADLAHLELVRVLRWEGS
jgi:rod shape-determining protein MreC